MGIRCVYDTNIVISSLIFTSGQLAWLRTAWEKQILIPIVAKETVDELLRVLRYPKFQLTKDERNDLLADFLPFAETFVLSVTQNDNNTLPICRDEFDQMFLDLAYQSGAQYLVTGDKDLLELNKSVEFNIVAAAQMKQIVKS